MNKFILVHIFIFLFINFSNCQDIEASSYKNLSTRKLYSVSCNSWNKGGKTIYEVNQKTVTKKYFNKYQSTWKNIEKCRPCILKRYNENDILLNESISYTDCIVGWYKEYYNNGKVKILGHYKENATDNWNDIWQRGYCSVKNGQWTYFNQNGDTLYSEFWKDGKFIKQIPEQDSVEIWDIELILNGNKIDNEQIPLNQVKNLKFIPKYKNSNHKSNISIFMEISEVGYKIIEKSYSLSSFSSIDFNTILASNSMPKEKIKNIRLYFYNGSNLIKRISLKVKE